MNYTTSTFIGTKKMRLTAHYISIRRGLNFGGLGFLWDIKIFSKLDNNCIGTLNHVVWWAQNYNDIKLY